MSGISNAYALLAQAGTGTPVAGSKTKKSKKKKCNAAQATQMPVETGRSNDQLEDEGDRDDFSFQVVRHKSKPSKGSTQTPNALDDENTPAGLEQAAIAAKGTTRPALVRHWLAQLSQHKARFSQSLLASHALERLLKGYAEAAAQEDAKPLAGLLCAVADESIPSTICESLAELLIACGLLSSRDPLAPRAQATAAATAAATLLRQGLPRATDAASAAASAASALADTRARMDRLETSLSKVGSAKDEFRLTGELVELARKGADIVLPAQGSRSASSEFAAALGALETLRSALVSRQRILMDAASGKGVQVRIEAANKEHAREDVALARAEAAAEEALAEARRQLAAAQAAVEEACTRRLAARKKHELTVQHLQSSADTSAAATAVVAEEVEAALGGASVFESALRSIEMDDGTRSLTSNGAYSAAAAATPNARIMSAMFVVATERAIESGAKLLKELSGKAVFFRDRVAASARQAQQLQALGDAQALEAHVKQRAGVEAMLRDVVASVSDIERGLQNIADAWRSRKPRVMPALDSHSSATALGIDALLAEAMRIAADISSNAAASSFIQPEPLENEAKPARKDASAASAVSGPGSGPISGRSTPSASVATADTSRAPSSASITSELAALEQRLALLEEENRRKDAQIAAMLAAASVEIPTPPPPPGKGASPWGRERAIAET